jgi:4-alpha-glucanotransferase
MVAAEGAAKSDLGRAFREFQRDGGQSLVDFAVFEALHEHYCREGTGFSWRDWPAPVRNPRSREVAEFATAHHNRVEFFQYLQWEAGYPPLAAASVATHDIATLKGFWLGRDIAWRRRLDLYPDVDTAVADERERRRDRRLLVDALVSEGLLAPERVGQFLSESGDPAYSAELGDAILTYVACTRARLMLIQLEDVLAEGKQANLPGTTDGHPNWRRRMSRPLEELTPEPICRE